MNPTHLKFKVEQVETLDAAGKDPAKKVTLHLDRWGYVADERTGLVVWESCEPNGNTPAPLVGEMTLYSLGADKLSKFTSGEVITFVVQ